jgi:RNA processing factor Prp31
MWIEEEIEAHHEWKLKLTEYAQRCDNSIVVNSVCSDQHCRLGKLLKPLKEDDNITFPEMDDLLREHRSFHRVVGELVKNINNGVKIDMEMSFGTQSPFTKHVTNVEKLLNKPSKVIG